MRFTAHLDRELAARNGNNKVAKSIGVLALAAGALLGSARPSAAQLRVCNRSNERVSMAVAYHEEGQPTGELTSRGWYNADPGECPVVVGGPLQRRYYYLRGDGAAGTTWGGAVTMCTAQDRFRYVGRGDCEQSGFRTETFLTIDTGDDTAVTFNLTPSPSSSGSSMRDAVANLRVGWRTSGLVDTTMVMQIHNDQRVAVNFDLKCFTTNGAYKILPVFALGNSVAEVGFLQGWPGNFVSGEWCEAYYENERVWTVSAPRH